MGKTADTVENTTPSSAELAALEAQERISQLEAALKSEQEARAKAEEAAEIALQKAQTTAANAGSGTVVEKEERVAIKLFKDTKEYKDDLTVIVNGKAYQIRRGVEVNVPKSVAEVIEHSAEQDRKTAELIESLIAETEQREREMK